jgi:hypothetical protein
VLRFRLWLAGFKPERFIVYRRRRRRGHRSTWEDHLGRSWMRSRPGRRALDRRGRGNRPGWLGQGRHRRRSWILRLRQDHGGNRRWRRGRHRKTRPTGRALDRRARRHRIRSRQGHSAGRAEESVTSHAVPPFAASPASNAFSNGPKAGSIRIPAGVPGAVELV